MQPAFSCMLKKFLQFVSQVSGFHFFLFFWMTSYLCLVELVMEEEGKQERFENKWLEFENLVIQVHAL